jgi:hypothetical protein
MKKVLFCVLSLAVCCLVAVIWLGSPVRISQTDNLPMKIDLLFIHDGCKVYRFVDDYRFVYYAKCDGSESTTEWEGETHRSAEVKTSR